MEKGCGTVCHNECLTAKVNNPADPWRCADCIEPSTAQLLREIRKIGLTYESLAQSVDNCHDKIDENNSLIKAQDLKIKECHDEIEQLMEKCNTLAKENEELKANYNGQE